MPHAGTPSSRSDCSKPLPAWPWMLLGMGHLHLLLKTFWCFTNLKVKNFFIISNVNLPSFSLKPLLLSYHYMLSSKVTLQFSCSPLQVLKGAPRSLWSFSSEWKTQTLSRTSLLRRGAPFTSPSLWIFLWTLSNRSMFIHTVQLIVLSEFLRMCLKEVFLDINQPSRTSTIMLPWPCFWWLFIHLQVELHALQQATDIEHGTPSPWCK